MQVLRLPASDDLMAAQEFVKRARKFEDAGFLIVGVDNKTNQSVRYACEAIGTLPRSFRKADCGQERIAYLPSNISNADKQAAEEKQRNGTFTKRDLDKLWRNYQRPATSLNSPWNIIEEVRPIVLNKRKRGEKLIEEKQFNFVNICRELERMDSEPHPKGDFIKRLRL